MRKSISIRADKTAAGSGLDRQVERSHSNNSDNDEVKEEVQKGEQGGKIGKVRDGKSYTGLKAAQRRRLHAARSRQEDKVEGLQGNAKRPRCASGDEEISLRARIRDEGAKAAESFDVGEKELSKAPAVVSAKDSKEYTRDEVSRHTSPTDCWIIIRNDVLDVSKFLSNHPGGEDIIFEFAGSDATEAFEHSGHPSSARALARSFVVGTLCSP